MWVRQLSAAVVLGVGGGLPCSALSAAQPAYSDELAAANGTLAPQSERLEVCVHAGDPEWIARAEGQLSDLPAGIHLLLDPIEPDLEQQLAAAERVGTRGLVVWLLSDTRAPAPWASDGDGAYLFAWFARARSSPARPRP